MTKEQKIADIRAKCIEANSEIIELKFGCKVKVHSKVGSVMSAMWNGNILRAFQLIITEPKPRRITSEYVNVENGELYEIIGRPICLADVMRAINNMMIVVDCNGNFYRMAMKLSDKMPKIESHLGAWALPLTLEDQPDETIDFIHDILNTTK